MQNIGYIIPEFPGQTHIWMWREITHMREWGVPLTIFSTRRPAAQVRARHQFADAAEAETVYLWPASAGKAIGSVLWALARHPIGFLKAAWLGLTLPVDRRPAAKSVLPLLVPAAIFARECVSRDISRLHSHTCSNSAVLCMMVKRILGMPFSMTLNANIEWWGGAMGEKFADAEFTIAITQWLLDEMHRDYPTLKSSQALLGRIGVDTRRWAPNGQASVNGSTARTIRLMTVGRLDTCKGHDILLRAVKLLVEGGKDVSLRLAGGGPERDALDQLTAELGLADRVNFLGSLPEDRVIDELKTADLFVLASHAEPLGVVFMEAMALGLPTIGTAAGGVAEIITNGEDGLLVPPKNPQALAEAISSLMSDDSRRKGLGEAGRQKIVREFDSRIGAATLYERLLGEPAPIQRH